MSAGLALSCPEEFGNRLRHYICGAVCELLRPVTRVVASQSPTRPHEPAAPRTVLPESLSRSCRGGAPVCPAMPLWRRPACQSHAAGSGGCHSSDGGRRLRPVPPTDQDRCEAHPPSRRRPAADDLVRPSHLDDAPNDSVRDGVIDRSVHLSRLVPSASRIRSSLDHGLGGDAATRINDPGDRSTDCFCIAGMTDNRLPVVGAFHAGLIRLQ